MATEIQIHKVQAQILKVLLFKTEARFGQLNSAKLPTDHFTFHLRQLVEKGLVEKKPNGRYQLTSKGKEFANRFDTEKVAIERQPKLGVLVVAIKKEGRENKYLTQVRLKQPFYGCRGFVTGKIRWGEKLFQAAARELKEETGLTANLELAAIEHKMDYNQDNEFILEDKFFFVIRATDTRGKLIKNFEGGENAWLTEKEIITDKNLFKDVPKIIEVIKEKRFSFIENDYHHSTQRY